MNELLACEPDGLWDRGGPSLASCGALGPTGTGLLRRPPSASLPHSSAGLGRSLRRTATRGKGVAPFIVADAFPSLACSLNRRHCSYDQSLHLRYLHRLAAALERFPHRHPVSRRPPSPSGLSSAHAAPLALDPKVRPVCPPGGWLPLCSEGGGGKGGCFEGLYPFDPWEQTRGGSRRAWEGRLGGNWAGEGLGRAAGRAWEACFGALGG